MAAVVVIGGGVGGLCAAIRLGAAGHAVTLVEQQRELGGKLGEHRRDGFRFDTGPALLTVPALFQEVLALAGAAGDLDLVRLDPQVRYHWPDGSSLDQRDEAGATADAFEAMVPGAGSAWRRFDARGARIWAVAERTFLAGPMGSPRQLVGRLRSPRDLWAIDPLRTLHGAARRTFADRRLVQWAGRYATYSGSSPFRAPATLACIAHVESAYGAWFPLGGMARLRDALVAAAAKVGVVLRPGVTVGRIRATDRQVTGVSITSADDPTGSALAADVVVCDADAHHLYRDLLPDAGALRRLRRARPSTSALVVLAGVDGATPGVAHHQVWFSADERAEFAQLAPGGRLPDDPTIYACVASATDPSAAPPGAEGWFLLVNAPAGWRGDVESEGRRMLARLAGRGVDLRPRLRFLEVSGPAELEARHGAPGGAIYGTSSDGRRAAFLRPGNRGPRRGLYLVGGSAHPGGGLPLVAVSARIVAELVEADGW